MARDLVDVALNTLMVYLADETGIPTGSFFFQYPNDDFVNSRTFQTYPSVGICEADFKGGTKFTYNNYGCPAIGDLNTDGSYQTFFPLGRKKMTFMVDLWAETQAQRRKYRNLIEIALMKSKSLATDDFDPIPSETITVELMEYGLTEDKPYGIHFLIEVNGNIYSEEDNYIVDQIEITGCIAEELAIPTGGISSGWIVITSGGLSITGDPGYY